MAAFRAKFMKVRTKLKRWTSPVHMKAVFIQKIRAGFTKLLDVRPRDRSDYYGILRWLVSKRLAYALVVTLGLLSVVYLVSLAPKGFFSGAEGSSIPTYRYRSVPLKFYEGSAKIEAKGKYIAYEGQVSKGAANGKGTLFNADGDVVYEGEFLSSRYNGTGTQYYPGGVPRYVGTFTNNTYDGKGSYFRPNGTLEYEGDYITGIRTGTGTLCNGVGDPVYTGKFLNNDIVYSDFLARPTKAVADLYTGRVHVYQSTDEYCVTMDDIGAIYSVRDGSKSLENEWTVDRLFVLDSKARIGGKLCATLGELQQALGEPLYFGTAWVNLPEAVAWNVLAEERPDEVTPVAVKQEATLEEVYQVSSYDRNAQVYLYTFEESGLLYTFYFTDAGEKSFVMYAMEQAG